MNHSHQHKHPRYSNPLTITKQAPPGRQIHLRKITKLLTNLKFNSQIMVIKTRRICNMGIRIPTIIKTRGTKTITTIVPIENVLIAASISNIKIISSMVLITTSRSSSFLCRITKQTINQETTTINKRSSSIASLTPKWLLSIGLRTLNLAKIHSQHLLLRILKSLNLRLRLFQLLRQILSHNLNNKWFRHSSALDHKALILRHRHRGHLRSSPPLITTISNQMLRHSTSSQRDIERYFIC